ncbi:hypothetical protein BZZ01_14340 [Nostocales cyanobacterium HT-58-2]|nr:hypothetical protein BZZ01_14340 [Nostocales cyanobacterium HT-58-2]
MTIKIVDLQDDLFEELSDAELTTVVGGTASGFVSGVGKETGNVGRLVGDEIFGEDGVLDLYDFLFR